MRTAYRLGLVIAVIACAVAVAGQERETPQSPEDGERVAKLQEMAVQANDALQGWPSSEAATETVDESDGGDVAQATGAEEGADESVASGDEDDEEQKRAKHRSSERRRDRRRNAVIGGVLGAALGVVALILIAFGS